MIRRIDDPPVLGPRSLGRVLLLSASVGGGHTRAAEAVAAWIRRLAGDGELRYERLEVQDVLAHATPWFRAAYRGTYLGLLKRAPNLLGWLYARSDRAYRGVGSRWATAHANLAGLRRAIADLAPDTIVSTHFLPSEYLAGLRRRGRLKSRLLTVVTDEHVHGMWLADPCDRYFVAGPGGRATLEQHGVPPERIEVSGIPIDPGFAEGFAEGICPAEARARLGLPDDRPIVLFTTGGACVGPVEELFGLLLGMRTRAHVVAVCGRSAAARASLERRLASHQADSPVTARVLGFSTRMHELMAAADLLVGKPGGLTSSEATASGLPMAIVHAVPGQEEHNARALVEAGCAIRCRAGSAAAGDIEALLGDPLRRVAMAEQGRAKGLPLAGLRIARSIAGIAGPSSNLVSTPVRVG